MKSSKRIVQDYKYVGAPGLPVNNFTGASYLTGAAFPNTTTLYGWRAGANGFTTVLGGQDLTENGTLAVLPDHLGNNVDCGFTGSQYLSNSNSAFAFVTATNFSMCAWVNLKTLRVNGGYFPLITRRTAGSDGFGIYITETLTYMQVNGSNYFPANFDFSGYRDSWVHIAWVRNYTATKSYFYVNGIQVAQIGAVGTITAGGNLEIGSYNGGIYKERHNSQITDVWIHKDTAWTDAQVMAIYTASLPNHTHDQQFAGHILEVIEPGTASSEVLALYKADTSNILADATGNNYALTNGGSVTVDSGIFGNGNNAWRFNGSSQYLTQSTLLDVVPSNGIAIHLNFKADVGSPAATKALFSKLNTSGSLDYFFAVLTTSGQIRVYTANSSTGTSIGSVTTVVSGTWYDVWFCWDVFYGLRLYVNGILEARDSSFTTLMANGTYDDFALGSYREASTMYYLWAGVIANFKVLSKIITQQDVDIAYSTRYDKTLFPANQLTELSINAKNEVQEWQTNFPIIAQDSNYIYRQGFTPGNGLKPGHRALIKGGY